MMFWQRISTCLKASTYFVLACAAPPRTNQARASDLIPLRIRSILNRPDEGGLVCMSRNTWSKLSAQRGSSSGRQRQSKWCLRDAFGWLVDPEVWLRAGRIAALRDRDSAAGPEPLGSPVHARCSVAGSANRANAMNKSITHQHLPLRIRVLLWLVLQIERVVLENCPRGHLRRSGLAWVDQTHAQVRVWLEQTNGGAGR
jgi:hypothetical protein